MGPVMAAWLVEVGIISVRDLVGPRRLPLPSELLATFVVFGGLALTAESPTFKGPANATAWGLVLATVLSSKVDVLRPIGEFMSGQTGGAGPAQIVAITHSDPSKTLGPALGTSAAGSQIQGDTGNILRGAVG